ncbi:hypothetical protein ABZ816_42390 [Actinosynnema sp. NPDC047251]|uniref:Uncharacterized protein n=1 Tax=Saccharothrix espanaensis (strain ATCC 51144 / DSM 44229 / JCM 9112 / NBRC 15066 / NRRL 15764) TaxID=1179773 RepID=K0JXL0_SACES|nr:hypothetical protein [Saccharothrix espanaensis]CCH32605.1 hypothetical protein BN6_53420 [Saccharothrix espanaensis DSM 44229]
MTSTPCPPTGAFVVYLNPDLLDPAPFVCGAVIGDSIVDPETRRPWVPVLGTGHLALVDTADIVESTPRRP